MPTPPTFGPFWSHTVKGRLSAFAASDMISGSVVGVLGASGQDRNVVMLATANVEPLGVVRDNNAQYSACTVFDQENVVRGLCGASISAGANIGVSGVTAAVNPLTGNTVNAPVLGIVAGASGSTVWRAGVAEENANPGQIFSWRVNPRQLSGLA